MRRAILCAALASVGCQHTAPNGPVGPPPAIHPTEQFPAPPGFQAAPAGASAWTFTGRGTPQQLALWYRVSCVEFYDWTLESEDTAADGSRRLAFVRDGARLQVQVRGGDIGDSLECLVTLKR